MPDDIVILCPYCMSEVRDETVVCPTCGEDTTRDAKFEMTREELRRDTVLRCAHCQGPMHKFANVCPSCRTRQPELSDDDEDDAQTAL